MNERGGEMSERVTWALELGIAPRPGSSKPHVHSAVEAGTDRAKWVEDGIAHIAEFRDAMHGTVDPDSVPQSPSERWLAEGLYLETLATSKSEAPPLSAWLEEHPDAGEQLARSARNSAVQ